MTSACRKRAGSSTRQPSRSGPAEALRAHLPGLPILMISGFQSPEDAFGRSSDAVHGFIGKPFVLTQFDDALRAARQKADAVA